MKIYLVEMAGQAVRAFSTRELAQNYVQCCLEEWDDELNEPRYQGYEFTIEEMELETK